MSRGLTSGGAFENVTRVVEVEFLGAGKVGVTRARSDELPGSGIILGIIFYGKNLFPVGPIAIFNA